MIIKNRRVQATPGGNREGTTHSKTRSLRAIARGASLAPTDKSCNLAVWLRPERDTSLRVLISKCLHHKDTNSCMKALSSAKEDVSLSAKQGASFVMGEE